MIRLTVGIVPHVSNLSGLQKMQKVLFGEHALQHILQLEVEIGSVKIQLWNLS